MMKTVALAAILLMTFALGMLAARAEQPSAEPKTSVIPPPTTVAEARARARLLHETIRGTLQVVHRDFFEEDGSSPIPSASMSDVFTEMARSFDVKMRWLIVQTDVMNVDHRPQDDFEKQAAKQLAKGKPRFESVENGRYRFAGPIRLASQCLKCHVKARTSNEDRIAGLLISMPLGIGAREVKRWQK
jgi:hypothetical protein